MATNVGKVKVVDSHTEGEPTRVVVEGGPDLGAGSLAERRVRFREQFDHFRSSVMLEPRGSDILVGALLCAPVDPTCCVGVVFFNNAGVIGMCGHGMIGVMATLAHLGRIVPGEYRIETPVGPVSATLHGPNDVSIRNVASHRLAKHVTVEVPEYGPVTGDIAWGGNWFFLVNDHREALDHGNVDRLTEVTLRIRDALRAQEITGADGADIDHIELFGPARAPEAQSRNFVLCPGGAYDRSPCGTGTSAKLACLIEDGKLQPGDIWRQESIIGSMFEASAEMNDGQIIPRIRGSAYICSEATLLFHPDDPFRDGIRPDREEHAES